MLLASYWNGGELVTAQVKDISETGAYLKTRDRWYRGTILNLRLSYDAGPGRNDLRSLVVTCEVVRHEPDGMAVHFLLANGPERKAMLRFLEAIPAGRAKSHTAGQSGQSLVEFAFVVPLVMLLIVNAVNFGGFFYAWITVADAARAGAQYAALGSSSVQSPKEAKASDVITLVRRETSNLAHASATNPVVTACQNDSGTVTLLRSLPAVSCAAGVTVPGDPEVISGATTYTSVAVDVTYTYTPLIPLFDFPGLNIHATLPATTIHRRAVMRILN